MTTKPQQSNEYVSGDMRGAHLKLAQRHRKIIAGQLCGNTRFEAECSTPGVVTSVVITFTTGALLSKDSRITCVLPDHGWGFLAPTINAEMRLPAGHKPTTLSTIWIAPTRTLEFTLLDEEVAAATPVVIYIPGVTTPESATPAAEAIITAYEKLVVRNTVPPSTRGGQIIDGPTLFTIAAVQPGGLTGVRKWQPFSCCPSAISETKLAFTVHGNVPANCKVVVALPSDGWDMDELPNVLLQTSEVRRVPLQATWLRSQHKLEINIGNCSLKEKTAVTFTIMNVRNPAKEIVTSTTATVTTLTALGGVIDGPTKIDVACISELRDTDFDMVKSAFDAVDVEKVGFIEIDKVHQVFDLSGVVLTSELYDSLVIGNLPVNDVSSTAVTTVTRDQILNIFAIVYAPAYKYGQELRLSSGRGEVHRIVEWIRRGCDPNHKDGSGWTALHYAADYGRLESINALVETVASVQGATCVHPRSAMTLDVNVRDVNGWTPLLCAAANGHVAVMEKLLALGADHTIASTDGRTALHWAATRGMEASVTALLMAGANPNAIDRIGWTAMHCAMLHGNNSSTDVLNKNGANSRCKDLLQHEPARYSGAATV